jgi:hypothetical protein
MSDRETSVDINLRAKADTASAHSEYDALFADLKQGVVDALNGQGVDPKFIAHVADEFERLNAELKETGATGDVVVEKIVKLEQSLTAAAAAEERRVRQLKVNFEMALHEKDVQEEAAALQRRRREEDQLAMEMEGIQLKKNTELLEQQIMEKLKAERLAREGVQSTQAAGAAMQGTKRDIGQALLVGSQFADDMQYGLKAVTGQIPQLAAAFGLGAGVAGVIGIAAVAVNLLWKYFGGAKDAKAETEKVTASMTAMKASLESASKAAEELFKLDLAKQSAEVDRLTGSWERQAQQIKGIVADQQELARIQIAISNHKLEIERQTKLADADTEEKRKAINTDFDYRKAAQNDAGSQAAAKLSLKAQQAQDDMLKGQQSNVQRRRDDVGGKQFENNRGREDFKESFGDHSDQGRRVREAEAAQKKLLELQEQQRKMEAFNQASPAVNSADAMGRDSAAQNLREQIDAAARERDFKSATIESDRSAVTSGKGLKFDQLAGEQKKAADDKDAEQAVALAKIHAAALERQKKLDDEAEALQRDAKKLDEDLKKIKEARVESAKQTRKSELQVEESNLAAQETAAKQKAKEAETAAKKHDESQKKTREEAVRKLENDAREAEQRGDTQGAADLKNKAEFAKLPLDAGAEEWRKTALDAQERRAQAAKPVQASGVQAKAENLAHNLGPAGDALKAAAAKLKDGATEKELEEVLKEFTLLSPVITKLFGDQAKRNEKFTKELQNLQLKLRGLKL